MIPLQRQCLAGCIWYRFRCFLFNFWQVATSSRRPIYQASNQSSSIICGWVKPYFSPFRQMLPAFVWNARIEIGWPFFNPIDKFGNSWMLPQRVNRMIISCQFGLGQTCMYFFVTNMVQKNRFTRFSASQLLDQMMFWLRNIGRNRPKTKRANRIIHIVQIRLLKCCLS